jgi:Protein of unknown function (DUF2587)
MTTGPESQPTDSVREAAGNGPLGRLVEDPVKVMRIGTSLLHLLDEVHNGPLDELARARLAEIHQRSVEELQDSLAPGPAQELERLWQPLTSESPASEEELRIGQAQLSGWIGGLVQDIQTAIAAKQVATRQMLGPLQSGAFPPGVIPAAGMDSGPLGHGGGPEPKPGHDVEPPGQYL